MSLQEHTLKTGYVNTLWEGGHLQAWKRALIESEHTGILREKIQSPEQSENESVISATLLSLWYLLWQPKQTHKEEIKKLKQMPTILHNWKLKIYCDNF